MPQTVPDFTTAIVTISFLLVLAIIAYIVKIKSPTLKKIIKKQDNLEVLNQISLRNGYLAYVFKVGEENFFFVGHKTGRGSLTQIYKDNPLVNNKTEKFETLSKNKTIKSNNNINIQNDENKPLQHVNISDLLTAHKKGENDA